MTSFIPGNFSDYGELSTISPTRTIKGRGDLFAFLPKNIKIKSMLVLVYNNYE